MSNGGVRLRPFREGDLELLTVFATDPSFSEPFEWGGFRGGEWRDVVIYGRLRSDE